MSSHNLCFEAKIRKIGTLYKSGVKGGIIHFTVFLMYCDLFSLLWGYFEVLCHDVVHQFCNCSPPSPGK